MIEVKGEDITPNKDGGILKEILTPTTSNEGPCSGDNVVVHYTGTLIDGTKFDSSRDRNEKFKFEIGKGHVIKGWDIGIMTMKRGESARFIIRSEYGYGEAGSPPNIPPKATLVFDVELFDFYGEDISKETDGSIVKRTTRAGEGFTTPNDGAQVEVSLKGFFEGRLFDERTVKFEIGEGSKFDVVEGIEEALLKFRKDEVARIKIKSRKAWSKDGSAKFNIPPHADVEYEVHLVNFEKSKETWQMDSAEKLTQSEMYKAKGTELFKEGKYALAVNKYKKIVELLETETYDVEEQKTKSIQLQVAANLNLAACYLKLQEFKETLDSCEKVLKHEAKNEKALFRIAQAHFGLANYQDAVKFFSDVLDVNASNKEAKVQIALTKEKIKESTQKEKQLYSKMFSYLGKGKEEPVATNGTHEHEHKHEEQKGCC